MKSLKKLLKVWNNASCSRTKSTSLLGSRANVVFVDSFSIPWEGIWTALSICHGCCIQSPQIIWSWAHFSACSTPAWNFCMHITTCKGTCEENGLNGRAECDDDWRLYESQVKVHCDCVIAGMNNNSEALSLNSTWAVESNAT